MADDMFADADDDDTQAIALETAVPAAAHTTPVHTLPATADAPLTEPAHVPRKPRVYGDINDDDDELLEEDADMQVRGVIVDDGAVDGGRCLSPHRCTS